MIHAGDGIQSRRVARWQRPGRGLKGGDTLSPLGRHIRGGIVRWHETVCESSSDAVLGLWLFPFVRSHHQRVVSPVSKPLRKMMWSRAGHCGLPVATVADSTSSMPPFEVV